jgi:hypothetical protein
MTTIMALHYCSISYATPIPPGMSPQKLNALVALEATANDILMLGIGYNLTIANETVGTWAGTIDDSGWSLTLWLFALGDWRRL